MRKKHLIIGSIVLVLIIGISVFLITGQKTVKEEWEWEKTTPEEQGMDSQTILQFLEYVEANDLNLSSLLVMRNGKIVTEVYYPPYKQKDKKHLYSTTKSILSSLVGIALEEGYLESIDQPAADFFSESYTDDMDQRKKEITIEDLLMMASGYEQRYLDYSNEPGSSLPEQIINRPLVNDPGKKYVYDDLNSHHLAAILAESIEGDLLEFAKNNLFTPVGIEGVKWINLSETRNLAGNYYSGAAGVYLTPREMAKFGQLFLDQGYWEGEEVVPKDWVEQSTSKHIETFRGIDDYGYHWWSTEGGYFSSGLGGQHIKVIPKLDLVVVTTGNINIEQEAFPLEILTYAVEEDLDPNPEAVNDLEEKIDEIENPERKEVASLPEKAAKISGQKYELEDNDLGLETIEIAFESDSAKVTSEQQEMGAQTIKIGLDNIYRQVELEESLYEPVTIAAKGDWISNNRFQFEMIELGEGKYDVSLIFNEDELVVEVVNPVLFPVTGHFSPISGEIKE